MEIWKEIPGYEGLYEVSTLGKVRSLNYRGQKNNIKILTPYLYKKKYQRLLLKDGKAFFVHQLVAMAFLDHKPNYYDLVVDHINNNSLDNRLENLQIVTVRKNVTKDRKTNLPTGVRFRKNRYVSYIEIQKKKKYLGCFSTSEEASEAYQKALQEIN